MSHDLMQWFYGSLVKQNDSGDKNHENINFDLALLSGIRPDSDTPDIDLPYIWLSSKFAIPRIPT